MSLPLSVLILEDLHADALLVVHALRQAGFAPSWRQAISEEEFVAALEPAPDLILADYTLPQFDALRALDLMLERGLDIPFIIVSGTIGEETAVAAMQRGAADYLLKDRLARLGMAVRGALQRRQLRAEQQRAIAQLRDSERRFRALIEGSADGIAVVDAEGRLAYVSPAAERITGFPLAELAEAAVASFIHPRDRQGLRGVMPKLLAAPGTATLELRVRHSDGSWRWLEVLLSNMLDDPAVAGLVVNYRDITARKSTEDELRQYTRDLTALHRMERRARLQAQTLREANLALTRSLSLEVVLGALFTALGRLVPFERASVILLDDDAPAALYQIQGAVGAPMETKPPEALDDAALARLEPLLASGTGLLCAGGEGELAPDWLAVPLWASGALLGICALEAAHGELGEEHLQWVEAVAAQSAVALQNARLFAEGHAARERLRTLSHELIRTQETERRGLARELHDEVGQVLIALQLNLRALQERKGGAAKAARLADSIGLVERLIQQIRTLSRELRPPLLDDLGLAPALRWHLDRLAERSGLAIALGVQLAEGRLPADLEISAFRIVQEALTNVVKHARASRVQVDLRQSEGELRLSVTDDGVGFDPDAARARAAGGSSLGLVSMQERAGLAGGRVEIIAAPDAGTCVRARFALPQA